MAANDQVKHVSRIQRQTRTGARHIIVGEVDYQVLDETDPKNSVFIDGGAPAGAGITVGADRSNQPFYSGEYLIIQAKSRMGSNKTLDSTGSTSGLFLLGVLVRDVNSKALTTKSLTEADRTTDLFADDPTLVDAKWSDAYAFKVPDGERWQLMGRWQQDLRTTA